MRYPPRVTDRGREVDVLVLGGGIAGLWILDALDEAGFAAALVESRGLGDGQTLASQGIIHGGLKYTLRGLLNPSAEAISAMPDRWRASLEGAVRPDLRAVRVASPATWLWRSERVASKLAMVGARIGLRTKPVEVDAASRPAPLRAVPGTVYRVDEPVLDTVSLMAAFAARHEHRLAHGRVTLIARDGAGFRIGFSASDGDSFAIGARVVVLAAGAGNAELRATAGIEASAMQRRPLHMAMVRGRTLPELHGHCVDGAATRVTITTHLDARGGRVWQLGGQLAENGVGLEPHELLKRAATELASVLPGVDLAGTEWASYRVDRAERATAAGVRPDDAQCIEEDGIVTVWPTKLALAPRSAELVLDAVRRAKVTPSGASSIDAARPPVGTPPWERATWSPLP